jgi:hypothetical protein
VFLILATVPAKSQRLDELIDVGGYRLHLVCEGQVAKGQPTVILHAEVGVKYFLEKLSPFLKSLGVSIQSIDEEFDYDMRGGYTIKVNSIEYELY